MSYRFHILGIPHTVSTKEYSSCAFTQKVVKLCQMLTDRGHHVIHYGHEDSDVRCSEHVTVTTREDLHQAYGDHDWRGQSFPKFQTGDAAYRAFDTNAIAEIAKRKQRYDFLLCSFGDGHRTVAVAHPDMIVVEPGIGYTRGRFAQFKVYESYAMMHACLGLDYVEHSGSNIWYDAVIPNYFDPDDFEFSEEKDDYYLFLGRVFVGKGIHIAVQIVEELGGANKLIVAGAGEVTQGMARTSRSINEYVEHRGVLGTMARRWTLSRAKAVLLPSTYLEPFCGVQVEAMLSGTPIITCDNGAFAEINLHGITGYRCRTFEQFVWAARNVDKIDPQNCYDWAIENFSMKRVGEMYDEYFTSVMDIYTGDGWYEKRYNRQDLGWLYRYYP